MPIVQVLPLTTSANSTAVPRHPDGPYIPYDFSNITNFELFFGTFINNWKFLLAVVAFFTVVQQVAPFILAAMFGKKYTSLKKKQQSDLAIAFCSIVNCIISFRTAYLFVVTYIEHDFTFHNYHYQEIEGYEFTRLLIVGYFLWDVVVCIVYRWGFAWTAHGVASFSGTYGLAFPVTDQLATYFTGMFELTNGLLHTASLLRAMKTHEGLAYMLEVIFAVSYFFIRVLGGTYIVYHWSSNMFELIQTGRSHSPVAIIAMLIFVIVIMILQYVWFWEIIQTAMGWKAHRSVVVEVDSPSLAAEMKKADAKNSSAAASSTTSTKKTTAASPSSTRKRPAAKRED